ncbi:MAG: DUF2849 domain-containing protein [Paracoccus denitrificans]|nr:MAG: DUF2849 domain-containing protein [Paracoccus denitrificans]PZO85866.1 MAG: DUF2849 domain-containing protein [Paracoccus denitrificans]
MSKAFAISQTTPAVLTANDLRSGRCVWMAGQGWTTDPRGATLFDDQGAADLALLDAQAQAHIVVGPYLVEARRTDTGPAAAHFREDFRHHGPSVETLAQDVKDLAHV